MLTVGLSCCWPQIIGRFDQFEEKESVLFMISAKLNNSKTYLVLGTGINEGEEVTVKGRIILLELYWQMGTAQLLGCYCSLVLVC